MLSDTSTETECAELVKRTKPSAIGATWYKDGSNQCVANLGTHDIVETQFHRHCLFPGIYFLLQNYI